MNRTRVLLLVFVALAGCQRKLEGPAPSLASLSPPAVCTEQLTTTLTLSGDGLSPLVTDSLTQTSLLNLPAISLSPAKDLLGTPVSGDAVRIPDDPADPASSLVKWQSQQQMTFDVAPALTLKPGLYGVHVENRNGKSVDLTNALLAVPPPELSSVTPDLLCGDEPYDVVLAGELFIRAGALQPTVTIGTKQYSPRSMGDCRALPGDNDLEACRTLTVSIAPGELAVGKHALTVKNPETVACSSTEVVTLAVVPPPVLAQVSPDVATAAEAPVPLALTGTGFIKQGSTLPAVIVNTQPLMASSATGCTPIDGTTSGAESCTGLTVTVPQGTTPTGDTKVSVQNPPPAGCASAPRYIFLAPAPTLTRLAPPGICTTVTTATTVSVEGQDFFRIGGSAIPTVNLGTRSYTPALDGASCTAVTGYSQAIDRCTRMDVTVGASDFTMGDYPASVRNPAPVAASSTQNVQFSVAAPPTLTSVTPARICSNGGTLTLAGTNFTPGMAVTLKSPAPATASMVSVTGSTSASATFSGPLQNGGPYDVEVTTGAACSSTLTAQVQVTPGPVVYFMDPPVVFNGITTQATIYASGFSATGLTVQIRVNGQTALQALTTQYNPAKANRILVTLPQGLAAGSYDVLVSDALTAMCPGRLLNAFRVVSQTTLSLTAIDPPFGYTGAPTAVTLSADAMMGGGLQALPRIYLNPATTGALAIPLESVALINAGRATAVVPSGQALGTYSLIVVNPDGGVGVLTDAFRILPDPTPFIDSVSPVSMDNQGTKPLAVAGGNFRAPVVTLRCRDAVGATTTLTLPAGTVTASSIATTIPTPPTAGTVCVVRVTNGDTSYAEYSAVTFTNPAQNPSAFRTGSTLGTARRALVSASGPVTRAAQFVYAIGGDDGAATPAALDTVEAAPLDVFGAMGTFFPQRQRLTTPRAFATGQRIGRWLYVAGGRNGSTVLNSIERAYLLDPADRVDVTDLDFDIQEGNPALAPGFYSYRVAAVMGASDAFNPAGENLPSDPFPVLVPATAAGTSLTLRLTWAATPGATKYRVYRTAVNGASGAERLLAEVNAPATQFIDDGSLAPAGLAPLPLGSTGTWNVVGTMAEAREGAGSTQVSTSATQRYLYVVGGKNAAGTLLASYVKVPIAVAADASQTVGTIATDGTNVLSAGRWLMSVQTANAVSAPIVGANQYVYVIAGSTGAMTTGVVQAATVDAATGTLTSWTAGSGPSALSTVNPNRAGFASVILNGFLYGFGGVTNTSTPDQNGTSSNIVSPAPSLSNWNSTSIQMTAGRYLMGATQNQAFFYVLGGQTPAAPASASTEQLVW